VVPWRGLAFLGATSTLLGALAALAWQDLEVGSQTLVAFAILAALAAATDFFTVLGARNSVYDTAAVFLVAAAVVLPPGLAPFVAVPACVVDVWRRRASSASLVHNIAMTGLATLAASALARLPHDGRAGGALVLALAVVAYAAVTTGLDGLFSHFARGDRLPAVSLSELGSEVVLASLGVGVAVFWKSDPWLIPFLLTPLVYIHRSQRLPLLEEEAITDPKTGLYNMRRFEEQLGVMLAKAVSERRQVCLLVADLDLLRDVNNRFGHLAGDAVIQDVSDLLRQHIRRRDIAARFGGEEFLLALPDTSPTEARRIAERIRQAVASRIFSGESPRFATRSTVSIGIAAAPRDAAGAKELIHAADLAVLEAKARGRDRVVEAAEVSAEPHGALPALVLT
jgi:diguanylate cyclase (GGDEF)-like protein